MKKFDPTKPVQTIHRLPARILATDFKSERGLSPIVAAVEWAPGCEEIRTYTSEGVYSLGTKSGIDLVNIPPAPQSITRWAVIYPAIPLTGRPCPVVVFDYERDAQRCATADAIAIVPVQIEFAEGQGL